MLPPIGMIPNTIKLFILISTFATVFSSTSVSLDLTPDAEMSATDMHKGGTAHRMLKGGIRSQNYTAFWCDNGQRRSKATNDKGVPFGTNYKKAKAYAVKKDKLHGIASKKRKVTRKAAKKHSKTPKRKKAVERGKQTNAAEFIVITFLRSLGMWCSKVSNEASGTICCC